VTTKTRHLRPETGPVLGFKHLVRLGQKTKISREQAPKSDYDRFCKISHKFKAKLQKKNINGRDVQRKNVVNKVDKSCLWAP